MAKCEVCGNEFQGKVTAKYCSSKCRAKSYRVTANVTANDENVTANAKNVTANEFSVTNEPKSSVTANVVESVSVTANAENHRAETKSSVTANKWDSNLITGDPLKRITKVTTDKIDQDYWTSQTYLNLIEELELKSIKQLEDEGYHIPGWKYAGYKTKPCIKKLLPEF